MLFLRLFFLLFLPFLIDGIGPFEKCNKDACLQYSSICDEGRGIWTAKTKNEIMNDTRCILKDEEIKSAMPNKNEDDYFYIEIDIISSTQWNLSIYADTSVSRSFIIKSPRIDLRRNESFDNWNLTVDGENREIRIYSVKLRNIDVLKMEINETTPLLDLFSGSQVSITINNTNTTYDDPLIWRLVAERGPISCKIRDTKPAFLIILIAYAVFSTIVAFLLFIMIYCIAREAKYKRMPSSKSNLSRKELSRKESKKEPNLPDLDPTTQGTKEVTVTKEASATDISRLKTESKLSKKS